MTNDKQMSNREKIEAALKEALPMCNCQPTGDGFFVCSTHQAITLLQNSIVIDQGDVDTQLTEAINGGVEQIGKGEDFTGMLKVDPQDYSVLRQAAQLIQAQMEKNDE